MEQFLNEALLTGKGVTLGDALSVGGMVTGVGISIVFSVLVILMIVLMLFKVIFYRKPADTESVKTEIKVEKAPEVSVNEPKTIEDGELIAVLTAAVAASLNTSTYNLKIKSYRRVEDHKPSWRKAGITETINNRF